MATGTRRAVTLAAALAAFAALALISRKDICLVVSLGLGFVVLPILVCLVARRENRARIGRACRLLADAFWGIG